MINRATELDIICRERDSLRQELVEMEKAMHKTVFVFLTACVAFVGIYFDEKIIKDPRTRYFLLLGLTQAEFFAWLFLICLMNNQNVHAGYIRAIEEHINSIFKRPVSFWDSRITRRFIASPRGLFFWSSSLLATFSLLIFGFCTVIAVRHFGSFWLGAVLFFEVALVLGLLVAGIRETTRVQAYTRGVFASLETPDWR